MYQVLVGIVTALALTFWIVKDKFVNCKIDKNISCIIYFVVFNIIAIIFGRSALGTPNLSNGTFIVEVIIAVIICGVKNTYIPIKKYENKSDSIYYNITQPIVQDLVLLGVVIPFLFGVKALYMGFYLSIVYINGGVAIAVLCSGIAIWFNKRDIDLLELLCDLIITFIHAQILIFTESVWILVVLRFVYLIMAIRRKK